MRGIAWGDRYRVSLGVHDRGLQCWDQCRGSLPGISPHVVGVIVGRHSGDQCGTDSGINLGIKSGHPIDWAWSNLIPQLIPKSLARRSSQSTRPTTCSTIGRTGPLWRRSTASCTRGVPTRRNRASSVAAEVVAAVVATVVIVVVVVVEVIGYYYYGYYYGYDYDNNHYYSCYDDCVYSSPLPV